MKITITLKAVSVGMGMTVEQAGITDMIPLDGRYLGWRVSLFKLAKLVEPRSGTNRAAVHRDYDFRNPSSFRRKPPKYGYRH